MCNLESALCLTLGHIFCFDLDHFLSLTLAILCAYLTLEFTWLHWYAVCLIQVLEVLNKSSSSLFCLSYH